MAAGGVTSLGGPSFGDHGRGDLGQGETGYPAAWEADVLLRDGHPVHLRPITPEDGAALRTFHASLSEATVYYRFFAHKPELSDQDVEYFTHVDHDRRVALVAADRGRIIGVARYDAIDDGSAEVAFVITDAVQGLGLGSVLLEHLAAAARERGVARFVAEVLPTNSRMISTFREAGYSVTQHREEDVLVVTFEIEPTAESRSVTAAREQRAEARSVRRLLHPRGVAVVGAGRAPGGLGHAVLMHLLAGGFQGPVIAVHREADVIAGVACVRSLAEVAGSVDLVVVVVPAADVAGVVADAARAGAHGLVVVSGGFGDAGDEGLRLQSELVSLVHGAGMRLVGPNALGIMNTAAEVGLNASLVPSLPPSGTVGLFAQSGALGASILERFRDRGLGISTFVSAGNRADVSGNDLLQYWAEDPRTHLVALYLETIGNARKFARIVHGVASVKPVLMVRTGGTGQRHPLGHDTSATTLSQRAVDQILGDCGLIVVDSVDQLIDVARVAVSQPLPVSGGIAVIGNSDALGVLATNAVSRLGMEVARPLVTLPRQAEAGDFGREISAARSDPAVGAVLVVHVPPVEDPSNAAIRAALGDAAASGDGGVPIIAVMPQALLSGASSGVPVFADVEDALAAVSACVRLASWRTVDERRREVAEAWPDADDEAPRAAGLRTGADAQVLAQRGGAHVAVAVIDGSGAPQPSGPGLRIELRSDVLFGPVVAVGLDDPVADALDDRSYRLAPVSRLGANGMLDGLGALSVLAEAVDADGRELLAGLVAAVSRLPALVPGVVAADLRGVRVDSVTGADLTVTDISVTVADEPATPEPAARRL